MNKTVYLPVIALLVGALQGCELLAQIPDLPISSIEGLTTPLGHDAQFLNQTVPLQMLAGESLEVMISFENTGTAAWSEADQHQLGLVATPLPANWGVARAKLPYGVTIESGEAATFVFTITAPATPGQYDIEWRMLQEQVEWFGTTSPVVRIEVIEAPRAESRCVINAGQEAATILQKCIDNAIDSGHERLLIPVGVYELNTQLDIKGPLMLTSEGKSVNDVPCRIGDPTCATLMRGSMLPEGGMINVKSSDVWLDHLILHGNRQIGGAGSWENVRVHSSIDVGSSNRFRFTNNISQDTIGNGNVSLPGWNLPTEYAFLYSNFFPYSGDHNAGVGAWSDAVRAGHSRHLAFSNNTILDGTDIDIITGEGGFDRIVHNRMVHTTRHSGQTFASIMLNDWKLAQGEARRDIHAGVEIAYNEIECSASKRCGIGISIGQSPWGDPATYDVVGTSANPVVVHNNTIRNAQTGLSVDDAQHVVLYDNIVTGVPLDYVFCHGMNSYNNEPANGRYNTFGYNISPDSGFVDLSRDRTSSADYVAFETRHCIPSADYSKPSFGQNALFVWQQVPGRMIAGQSYEVAILMTNDGASTWSNADGHRLGTEVSGDNLDWGIQWVSLGAENSVEPGAVAQFVFSVTAPANPGIYSFQWRMFQKEEQWFGQPSNRVIVLVI